MIRGHVRAGQQRASKIPSDVLAARRKVSETELEPGTLNIAVSNLTDVLAKLGEPDFFTDEDNKHIGPLQWWRVLLVLLSNPKQSFPAFIVRHERTRTGYLEVMAQIRLRDAGFQDGEPVEIRCA
jgi:CTP-dependent riboflavin kinase